MGQSSSKHQNTLSSDSTDSSSRRPVAGASTDLHPDDARDPGDESLSSHTGLSRSSSICKSLLNFVKPSNIRSRVSSTASHTDSRRSWRNSILRPKDSPTTSSSSSSTAGPSTAELSSTDKGKKPERTDSDDGDLEDTPTPIDLDLPIEQSSYPIPLPTSEILQDIEAIPEIVPTESLEPVVASPEDDETNTLYVTDSGEPELEQQPAVHEQEGPEIIVPSQPSSPLPSARFPPPGTLVVVQGIVHTTDVSRNNTQGTDSNSTSTSTLRPVPAPLPDATAESGTSRARNRLSALLRPRSASSRPPSTTNDSVPSVTVTPPADLDLPSVEPEVLEPFTQAIPFTNEPADAPADQPPLEDSSLFPTNHHNHSPSISSSSIDVLGTLLRYIFLVLYKILFNHHLFSSVVAAATAASLLTGSSDPILSSGLAPPNPSTVPQTNDNVPAIPNAPLTEISAAGRAERMRHAWGTIRERLGLRPSAPPPEQGTRNIDVPPATTAAAAAATATEPAAPISLPDTRELMLAEMTRAFNGGFGLGAHGIAGAPASRNNNQAEGESTVPPDANNTVNNQGSSDSRTPSLATLPPEGSFDRFLMDLQIDLRTALTQAEDLPHSPTHHDRQSTPSEPVQQSQEAETRTEIANDDGPSSIVHPLPETQHISHQHEDHHPQGTPESTHTDNVDSGRSSMPDLSEVYDTDSEFEDAEESDDDGTSYFSYPRIQLIHLFNFLDFHSARHASNPVLNNSPRTPTLGAGRIDALGRINWWRLYRFPPVMPPRLDMANFRPAFAPGGAAPTTTPSVPPTLPIISSTVASEGLQSIPTIPTLSPTSADPPSSSSSDTATSSSSTSIPPLPQTQDPPTPQTVVPVIVVGLQSVNSDWRPDMPPPDDTDMDVFGHNHGVGGAEIGGNGGHETFDDDDFDGFGNLQHPSELLPDEAAGMGAGRGRGVGAGSEGRPRGWQSRVPNAIRNLRPGRRPAPPGTQHSVTTPGSRTFLIYVIGGLYLFLAFNCAISN